VRQDIRSVRPVRDIPAEIRPAASAKVAIDFPPELLLCRLPRAESGLRPNRVLGDRIKVDDYLAKLRDRYNTLDNALRVRALLGRRAAVEANLSIERASGTLDGAARAQTSWFAKGRICGSFRF
jgi:hypothetical protein